MLLPEEMIEHKSRLMAMASEAGRTGDIPASVLVGTRITRDASVYPSLDAPHRRAARVGTVDQLVQLVAYRDAGVAEIHTVVGTDESVGASGPVAGMELFLREVWPAFLAA